MILDEVVDEFVPAGGMPGGSSPGGAGGSSKGGLKRPASTEPSGLPMSKRMKKKGKEKVLFFVKQCHKFLHHFPGPLSKDYVFRRTPPGTPTRPSGGDDVEVLTPTTDLPPQVTPLLTPPVSPMVSTQRPHAQSHGQGQQAPAVIDLEKETNGRNGDHSKPVLNGINSYPELKIVVSCCIFFQVEMRKSSPCSPFQTLRAKTKKTA